MKSTIMRAMRCLQPYKALNPPRVFAMLPTRALSTTPNPTKAGLVPPEPAEVGTPTLLSRPHELLQHKADERAPSWHRYCMLGGGTLAGGGGIALLGYAHLQWLMPLVPDLAGVSLLGIGGALLARAAKMPSSASDGGAPAPSSERSRMRLARSGGRFIAGGHEGFQIEIIPLNDELRYSSAAAAIASGGRDSTADGDGAAGGGSPAKPKTCGEAEEALKLAEKAEREATNAARTKAAAELVASLKQQLSEGAPARRLRQKLEPRLFVIDFDTRARASRDGRPAAPPSTRALLDDLREQVSLLLHVCSPYDEVVLRITSPGGPVTDYGLAAAHFARLKTAGVKTTAVVDLVAASGGYMIACAASQLLAAPFAIVGSIGVVAQAPNVHRLLEQNGVEVVQRTAGEYKRTIQIFQPNTAEGLRKFDEELALIHSAFIGHVQAHRANLDPAKVCTGESWLATHALPLGLIDGLATSDQYIRAKQQEMDAYLLRPAPPRRPSGLMALLSRTTDAMLDVADAARAALPLAGKLISWTRSSIPSSPSFSTASPRAIAADVAHQTLHEASGATGGGAGPGLAALGVQPPLLRADEFGGSALEADAARVGGNGHS